MKKIVFIVSLVLTQMAYLQTDTMKITAEDAVQFGLKNRLDIQSGLTGLDISKNEWNKAKYQWLPTFNGSANIRYNTQLPTTVLPAGAIGNPNDITAQFGTRNNTTLAVDFDQTLIKPTLFSDTKLGKNQYDQQKIRFQQKEKEIRKTIALVYYDALIKKRQWELAETNALQSKELLNIVENRYNLGSIKENDYLKQKLEYQNLDLKRTKMQQDYTLAMELLKKEMNLNYSIPLVLTEKLDAPQLNTTPVDTSFAFNADIKILQLQYGSFKINRKRATLNSLPSLSFYANYTLQFQANNFNYGQNWYPFNFIGIRLNVPIFNQWRNQATIKEFRLKMNQNQLDLQYKKQNLYYDYQKYEAELSNALFNLQYAEDNYSLAKDIYTKDVKQYELGFIGYGELLLSSRTQNEAEQNLMQSWLSYQVARLNYENIIQ
jgi:outer membrane protein TolC